MSFVHSAVHAIDAWIHRLYMDCSGLFGGAHPRKVKGVRKNVNGRGSYATMGRPSLSGRGGFWGDLWNSSRQYIPRGLGALAGAASGAGAQAGWDAGGHFSKNILGWGDYSVPWSVVGNSLLTKGQVPSVNNVGSTAMRINHVEFLGPIYSTTAFTDRVYPLNLGMPQTCPWSSNVAANFQQWELVGAVVVFKPSLPDGLASFSSLGNVVIAIQMNPSADAFTNQIEMEQTQFVASIKPTLPLVAPVECDPSQGGKGVLLVRTGDVPTGSVVQSYDHGKIEIATVGQASDGVMLGNVYLSIDALLYNPIFGHDRLVNGAHYTFNSASSAAPFGTTTTKVFDTVGLTFSSTVMTIPVGTSGNLHYDLDWVSSSTALTTPTITLANATLLTNQWSPNAGETATRCHVGHTIHITNPAVVATLTLSAATFGTISSGRLDMYDVARAYA